MCVDNIFDKGQQFIYILAEKSSSLKKILK